MLPSMVLTARSLSRVPAAQGAPCSALCALVWPRRRQRYDKSYTLLHARGKSAANPSPQRNPLPRSPGARPLASRLAVRAPGTRAHGMHTRALTTAASRRAVLETQELLEEILYHLSAYELGRAQGVCAHWRKTICAAPVLTRVRFLGCEKVCPPFCVFIVGKKQSADGCLRAEGPDTVAGSDNQSRDAARP